MSTGARVLAVVPLNATPQAKSRLRGALDEAGRAELVRWMAARVLAALSESGVVARVAVVSPDAAMLAWAAGQGAVPLRQERGRLNAGLELGRRWARAEGAEALLVALGDLPLLRAEEVAALAALAGVGTTQPSGEYRPGIALAPDAQETGTNLLLLRPPEALPFAFGRASFPRHVALARVRGIEPAILRAAGARFDVDLPRDLAELERRVPGAVRCLAELGGGAR
ncbi:MAG TPA: 2-phospho-L-lactate guanylyltransferase [Ktedonobacterales bacterium]